MSKSKMFRTVKFGEQGQLASFTGTSLTPREVEILRTIKCAVKPCFIARLTVRLNFPCGGHDISTP